MKQRPIFLVVAFLVTSFFGLVLLPAVLVEVEMLAWFINEPKRGQIELKSGGPWNCERRFGVKARCFFQSMAAAGMSGAIVRLE
jgi:hypothetical protein